MNTSITAHAKFSAAQMSASFTTPLTIIPAQGSGAVIWPKSVTLIYKAESGSAVVGGNATTVTLNSNTVCSQDFNGLTASTMYRKANALSTAVAATANKALVLNTPTADPTFYGAVEVYVEYDLINIA